jgi:hypothetical protein
MAPAAITAFPFHTAHFFIGSKRSTISMVIRWWRRAMLSAFSDHLSVLDRSHTYP